MVSRWDSGNIGVSRWSVRQKKFLSDQAFESFEVSEAVNCCGNLLIMVLSCCCSARQCAGGTRVSTTALSSPLSPEQGRVSFSFDLWTARGECVKESPVWDQGRRGLSRFSLLCSNALGLVCSAWILCGCLAGEHIRLHQKAEQPSEKACRPCGELQGAEIIRHEERFHHAPAAAVLGMWLWCFDSR